MIRQILSTLTEEEKNNLPHLPGLRVIRMADPALDNSFEVLEYDDKETLPAAIRQLLSEKRVTKIVYMPNYKTAA